MKTLSKGSSQRPPATAFARKDHEPHRCEAGYITEQRQLRPFFGYFGGKWRDALKHYPAPAHDTVVEPFAGSAGYSIRYAHSKIVLCELDPILSEVWRYLLRVKPREVMRLPDIPLGGTLNDLNIGQEAKWLIGFWLNRGTESPR